MSEDTSTKEVRTIGSYLDDIVKELADVWAAISEMNERIEVYRFDRSAIVNDVLVRVASAASGNPFDSEESYDSIVSHPFPARFKDREENDDDDE